MSQLMFWNKQNNAANQNNETKNGKRNWLHTPDVLVNGHVAYPVKFLGSTPVDQPKGIEVVKEAIRRLQFSQQIKKSEGGNNVKTQKVELTVSINGVAIQQNKTQIIMHQFPLHKISYCADEKGIKKFFSFIAKTGNTTNGDSTQNEDGHECFVFISNKLASDITLTIGQAFDLAYRRFVNDNGKVSEVTKLQLNTKQLENTVAAYKQRLKELSEILPKNDLDKILMRLGLKEICEVPAMENGFDDHVGTINGHKTPELGMDILSNHNDDQLLIETSPKHFAPTVPPRNIQNQINSTFEALKPSVGTKLEGLLLNSDSDSDFDPRACESETTNGNGNGNKITNDLFGFEPPKNSMGHNLFMSNGGHNNTTNMMNVANNNLINNMNNINNNHSSVIMSNGIPLSPPPLLAPPPKAGIPRRSVPTQNNKTSQDLFGSTPFDMQPSPFDATEPATTFNHLEDFVLDQSGLIENDFSQNNDFSHLTQHDSFSFNQNSVYNEITAFNTNDFSIMKTINPPTENPIKTNPFAALRPISPSLNELKKENNSTVPRLNPFGRTENILNRGNNYNNLKNTIEFENTQTASSNAKDIKVNKPEISAELFKDATSLAFKGFGKNLHEFSNKMLDGTNYKKFKENEDGSNVKNNFNNKNMKFGSDDFTLESLDPLK